jgi:two-component system sensor histidine kinase PhoQ
VLERGVRADETVPGHGLGLAMVRETIELYGGSIAVETSPLGGARLIVRLPGRV